MINTAVNHHPSERFSDLNSTQTYRVKKLFCQTNSCNPVAVVNILDVRIAYILGHWFCDDEFSYPLF